MTRNKSYNNRKPSNKRTIYIPDSQLDFVEREIKAGETISKIYQEAMDLLMSSKATKPTKQEEV
jgi:hypothetical protein